VVCDSNGSDSGVKNGGDQRGDGTGVVRFWWWWWQHNRNGGDEKIVRVIDDDWNSGMNNIMSELF
jgi:hypothetical protein